MHSKGQAFPVFLPLMCVTNIEESTHVAGAPGLGRAYESLEQPSPSASASASRACAHCLQNSKSAQGLAGLRNLGNTVSCQPTSFLRPLLLSRLGPPAQSPLRARADPLPTAGGASLGLSSLRPLLLLAHLCLVPTTFYTPLWAITSGITCASSSHLPPLHPFHSSGRSWRLREGSSGVGDAEDLRAECWVPQGLSSDILSCSAS